MEIGGVPIRSQGVGAAVVVVVVLVVAGASAILLHMYLKMCLWEGIYCKTVCKKMLGCDLSSLPDFNFLIRKL